MFAAHFIWPLCEVAYFMIIGMGREDGNDEACLGPNDEHAEDLSRNLFLFRFARGCVCFLGYSFIVNAFTRF